MWANLIQLIVAIFFPRTLDEDNFQDRRATGRSGAGSFKKRVAARKKILEYEKQRKV